MLIDIAHKSIYNSVMNYADPNTIKNINEAALKEFTEKGFKDASLRSIAKEAGVTTGAFYSYYKSKGELFESIVGEHARHLMELFEPKDSEDYKDYGKSRIIELTLYTYRNFKVMKLLVGGSVASEYENLFHDLTNQVVSGLMPHVKDLSEDYMHALISGIFASYKELVIHDAPRCKAGTNMSLLWDFYEAGWNKVLTK